MGQLNEWKTESGVIVGDGELVVNHQIISGLSWFILDSSWPVAING